MNKSGSSLRAISLRKQYRTKLAVEDVSLEVNSGEIVGLLGPNGAGKTTCFYMVVGLLKADAGEIYLDSTEITQATVHERAKHGIGYLPQEASVFRTLTTEQNLLAVLELRSDLTKSSRKDVLNSLIEEFNLENVRLSLGQSLSGGERRRLESRGRWPAIPVLFCWMSLSPVLTQFQWATSNQRFEILPHVTLAF